MALRHNVYFSDEEEGLEDHAAKQPGGFGPYIKRLIKADMENTKDEDFETKVLAIIKKYMIIGELSAPSEDQELINQLNEDFKL